MIETVFLGGVSSVLGQKHLLVLLLISNKKELNGSKRGKALVHPEIYTTGSVSKPGKRSLDSSRGKGSMPYVASKATWKHTKNEEKSYTPCYATHDTIEIQMARSTDYIAKAKKKALDLGWIQVRHRAGTSDQIWPVIGVDDPEVMPRVKRVSWGREDIVSLGEEE